MKILYEGKLFQVLGTKDFPGGVTEYLIEDKPNHTDWVMNPNVVIGEHTEEIINHIDGIMDDVDRMTSGNFMHNKNSIRFHAKIIKQLLKED